MLHWVYTVQNQESWKVKKKLHLFNGVIYGIRHVRICTPFSDTEIRIMCLWTLPSSSSRVALFLTTKQRRRRYLVLLSAWRPFDLLTPLCCARLLAPPVLRVWEVMWHPCAPSCCVASHWPPWRPLTEHRNSTDTKREQHHHGTGINLC